MTAPSPAPPAAVVTGAAGAIGSAVVDAFLLRGHVVVGIDQVPLASERGPSYRHVVADVRREDEIAKAVEAATDLDVRHLVGVAGGAAPGETTASDVDALDIELFRSSLELNLVSQYVAIRAFAPALRATDPDRRTSSITVISSINAIVGMDMPAYSAAKAGLIGMVRVLARTLGPDGVRVNAVLPGTVRTPRTERVWAHDASHFERLERRAPLGRLTTPDDVARTVTGLAIDLTAVTGQALVVDGGQTATWTE